MKFNFCAIFALCGSYLAAQFGGWDIALKTLVIFMFIDYFSGIIVPSVFHNSPKTPNGTLESRAGWKGLCRKFMSIFFVLIAEKLDEISGTSCVRDAVCIGFITNELISIVENAGLMGMKIPSAITKSIELLKDKDPNNSNSIPNVEKPPNVEEDSPADSE